VTTFKQFLREGGGATRVFNPSRASAGDIEEALHFASQLKTLKMSPPELRDALLGSADVTALHAEKALTSGDIDIAVKAPSGDEELKARMTEVYDEAVQRLKKIYAADPEHSGKKIGENNLGTRVVSLPVPLLKNGDIHKIVQLDLMFVKDTDWAKFSYHSAQNRDANGSAYKGVVRNVLLTSAIVHHREPGKDFVHHDPESGNVIARASRSLKMDAGVERLFKLAKRSIKTGKFTKELEKVSPADLESFLKDAGLEYKFSHDADIITDPDELARLLFGPGTRAKDILTAEGLIRKIKQLPNSKEILDHAVQDLEKRGLPVPTEI
jgi:hypothetical protein